MILFLFPMLQKRFKGRRLLVWLVDLIAFYAIAAIAFITVFHFAEKASWGESGWQLWQTATTIGFGNAPAKTNHGRWGVVIFGTVTIALMTSIIAAVFDLINEKKMRRRIGLLDNPYKNANVVFNLIEPTQFREFVEEVRDHDSDAPICIVDNRIEELPASIAVLHNIHFIRGSLLDQDTYLRARIRENRVVYIFPVDDENPDSDGTTRSIIDCVEDFVGADTRILYMLVSEANAWMFRHFKNATPLHKNLGMHALVHEAQAPHTGDVVQALLTNKSGTFPVTVIPNRIVGWTWAELQDRMMHAARRLKVKANLLALIKNGRPELCPDPEELIEAGDLLSIIANDEFDWDALEIAMLHDAAAPAFGIELAERR